MDKNTGKMKIGIIGIGKLGLCFGLNLSKVGHEVIGVDKNQNYIKSLNAREFSSSEEGVNDYLENHGFTYSTNIDDALDCYGHAIL